MMDKIGKIIAEDEKRETIVRIKKISLIGLSHFDVLVGNPGKFIHFNLYGKDGEKNVSSS